jgi:hypothetical protein
MNSYAILFRAIRPRQPLFGRIQLAKGLSAWEEDRMKAKIFLLCLFVVAAHARQNGRWRSATDKELETVIPARATVEKEHIETEMRTASGVTNGHGKFIAGVVMITAGYAADGKYSDFLMTQVPIKVADVELRPGQYVFGSHRQDEDTLLLTLYEADTGKPLGSVKAVADRQRMAVRSLTISPAENGKGFIKVGRFQVQYALME